MTPNEAAADRLRRFTADWSKPERDLVEDILSGRTAEPPPRIERRRAPGRPWREVR